MRPPSRWDGLLLVYVLGAGLVSVIAAVCVVFSL